MSSIILRLRVILCLIFTFARDIITLGGKNMDFLQKLDYLMKKNNLNKSSLSKACDIPYTTIDGWYKKGYEGLKLPTVRKLANYFGTGLDYWADDTILEPNQTRNDFAIKANVPEEEINLLLETYTKLPEASRKRFISFLEDLTKINQ